MIPGKKARNKRKEMAEALVPTWPFITASQKKRETCHSDRPCNPGSFNPSKMAILFLTGQSRMIKSARFFAFVSNRGLKYNGRGYNFIPNNFSMNNAHLRYYIAFKLKSRLLI